ncbi:MAG: hypothetical protein MZV49_02495 [Rhodopseudomonas palustris]|nr:hypothetical protein [Rhodopseudomonas palustris]
MERQQAISARAAEAQGRHAPAGDRRRGRGPAAPTAARKADAPEIDGAVYLGSRRPLTRRRDRHRKIERADAYDLYGTVSGF